MIIILIMNVLSLHWEKFPNQLFNVKSIIYCMIRFFVFEFNSKLEKTRIFDSFKSADEAYHLADKLNNDTRLHLSYYVSLCSVENVQREIDLKLIDACKLVADSLYLAERCLLSRNYRKRYGCADFWFNHAYNQCEQFSKYLE